MVILFGNRLFNNNIIKLKSQIDAIKKEYQELKTELEKPEVVSDGKK